MLELKALDAFGRDVRDSMGQEVYEAMQNLLADNSIFTGALMVQFSIVEFCFQRMPSV